jgi:hypothetical protein
MKFFATILAGFLTALAPACELCSIYSAENASATRTEGASGFIFTLSEQYVPYETLQVEGEPFPHSPFFEAAFMDSSITHFVPGYNFSSRLGVSLNIPYVYRDFRRTEITPFATRIDESGTISDLGDTALIARWTAFQKREMDYSAILNLLAGVKFPTGDTERLEDERRQEIRYTKAFGENHAHAFGGIHQHDLSPGTGSFDGVFGATANLRWKRFFFNTQVQYYLRTEAIDYEMGDLVIVSGGPGVYALLKGNTTLSIQANAFYEKQESDRSLDQINIQTGFTAYYFGPQLAFTWGEHFSANGGVDVPLYIDNRGIQSVPDYRVHGGVSWRF